MRQGTLLSWDPSTGNNTVLVAGQTFTDLPVLAAGSVAMAPGDIVALQRYGNSYFILGAIRNAGTGSLQTRGAVVNALASTSSTSFVDLSPAGPTVADVYIGSTQQCAVLLYASVVATAADFAQISFEVSGASSIPASNTRQGFLGSDNGGPANVHGSASGFILLTTNEGLNKGLNTFTAKYSSPAGLGAGFLNRRMAIIPF